jgi:hypothetical protein
MTIRRDSRTNSIEGRRDFVGPSFEKCAIRQHDIDFIGSIGQTSTDQRNDLGRLVTSSREIDDGRDRNPGSFELPDCTCNESRPDAHCSHVPIRTMCPSTQQIDVGLGTRIIEIREIDEFENALSEPLSRR